ncbi:MAG: WXG100 family type VII secretion target [Phycisphaerae bacterium]|jgi:uncharacterized protein YukE|nr:WXG100 family type VII secretion target [Phycisphaerae bacterium]MBT5583779.1 WXG100 family type VII secretion target [Phycisphaerae bacterium]MBT5656695.1 WXG100 family type VII secretion target [Phycisphaerae bacterium]MDG2476399.1 WXG100 family type VII secretion target [Phycisphaerales bacterium]
MAKAIIDPGEVRKFASDLQRFTNVMEEQMNALNSRHRSLGQTWKDQEHRKFSEDFEHSMRALARFREVVNEHIPFLKKKAQRAEDYLNQR